MSYLQLFECFTSKLRIIFPFIDLYMALFLFTTCILPVEKLLHGNYAEQQLGIFSCISGKKFTAVIQVWQDTETSSNITIQSGLHLLGHPSSPQHVVTPKRRLYLSLPLLNNNYEASKRLFDIQQGSQPIRHCRNVLIAFPPLQTQDLLVVFLGTSFRHEGLVITNLSLTQT